MDYENQSRSSDDRMRNYLGYAVFRVQGYLSLLDANLLRETIAYQTSKGISGSLVEIGVWHGKSFFILALGKAEGERCLAIDLFATRPLAKGEKQQLDEFNHNCQTLSISLDRKDIISGDSMSLSPADILSRGGKARLVHVDGAHDYDHAKHDLDLARNVVLDSGVIVIDDPFNHHWPEVGAAAFDWLRQNIDFCPWATTNQKLYVCKRDNFEFYEKMLRKKFAREMSRYVEAFNARFISLATPAVANIRERIMGKLLSPRQIKFPRPSASK